MKRKRKVPKWHLWLLCALSLIVGAVGGFLWGYHVGFNVAPPIILMSHRGQPDTVT